MMTATKIRTPAITTPTMMVILFEEEEEENDDDVGEEADEGVDPTKVGGDLFGGSGDLFDALGGGGGGTKEDGGVCPSGGGSGEANVGGDPGSKRVLFVEVGGGIGTGTGGKHLLQEEEMVVILAVVVVLAANHQAEEAVREIPLEVGLLLLSVEVME